MTFMPQYPKVDSELLDLVLCECGEKTVAKAIGIFQHTDLPYRQAKKLVTECNKNCCNLPLSKLFTQVNFGTFNLEEVWELKTKEKYKNAVN